LATDAPTHGMRLRKAWWVSVRGYDEEGMRIHFGKTASKVRYAAFLHASEYGISPSFADICVLRAARHDVWLPSPDPVVMRLTANERHCLLHAFGGASGDVYQAGYRGYFFTSADDATLNALATLGLFEKRTHPVGADGLAMATFVLTQAGRFAALSLTPEYNRRDM
jgi:hypothetical protein